MCNVLKVNSHDRGLIYQQAEDQRCASYQLINKQTNTLYSI